MYFFGATRAKAISVSGERYRSASPRAVRKRTVRASFVLGTRRPSAVAISSSSLFSGGFEIPEALREGRPVPAQRGSEVAVQDVPEVAPELLDDRPVEPLAGAELVDHFLAGVDRQQQLGGIAGQAGEEEDRDDEDDQADRALEGALAQVAKHPCGVSPPWGAGALRRRPALT